MGCLHAIGGGKWDAVMHPEWHYCQDMLITYCNCEAMFNSNHRQLCIRISHPKVLGSNIINVTKLFVFNMYIYIKLNILQLW